MFSLITTNKFDKDVALCNKRKLDLKQLEDVFVLLENSGTLPLSYKPHILSGRLSGVWEAHIRPDWLITWKKDDQNKTITLLCTGTHSDLFK